MNKGSPEATNAKNPEDKAVMIDFRFGKDSKVQPLGLDGLSLESDITVILKGKLTSFSNGEPYDGGNKRFSVKASSCEIEKPKKSKETTMDDAIEEANKTRKKVT